MSDQTSQDKEKDFLIEEYKKCWEYIQFHYQQRDRSQRFYFIFVLAGGSLVATLIKLWPDKLSKFPVTLLLLLIIPLFLIGIFCLGQIISLRKTTTLFHKTIVTIRAQLLKNHSTPLWKNDDKPKFYNKGFNYFTATIVMIITGFLLASGVFVILLDLGIGLSKSLFFSLLAWVVIVFIQLAWYRSSLKKEDKTYKPLFPRSEAGGKNQKEVDL